MLALASRLTDRDRILLDLLWDVRVLTSKQVVTMLFESPTTARHRLATLTQLGLLHPFRPQRPDGTLGPMHYLLDHLGSYVVAAARGADPETLDWRKERALAVETSQRLAHLVGVNTVLADLYRHARRTPGVELRWLTERQFAGWWDRNTVYRDGLANPHPDGYGVWTEFDRTAVPFALEYDRGTEPLHRLVDKLPGYVELAWVCAQPVWVLFAFTSARREHNARSALQHARPSVPVATATLGLSRAGDPVWRPLWHDRGEALPDLADFPRSVAVADLAGHVADPRARAHRNGGSLSWAEWTGSGPPPSPTLADHPPRVPAPAPGADIGAEHDGAIPTQRADHDKAVEPVIARDEYEDTGDMEGEWWEG